MLGSLWSSAEGACAVSCGSKEQFVGGGQLANGGTHNKEVQRWTFCATDTRKVAEQGWAVQAGDGTLRRGALEVDKEHGLGFLPEGGSEGPRDVS
jgi:ABC-type tungstate transport system permease subunit